MRKTFILSLVIVSVFIEPLTSKSQNYVYVGTSQYSALETWNFQDLRVTFAKKSPLSGILLVSELEDQFHRQKFGASLIVYLKNGKQIVLTPKLASDRLDGSFSAAYQINSANLAQMQLSDIYKVRYSVFDEFGTQNNFTALNEDPKYETIEMPVPEADKLSEIERLRRNIESKTLGLRDFNDPFSKPYVYYYRYETIKVSSKSVETSSLISSLY